MKKNATRLIISAIAAALFFTTPLKSGAQTNTPAPHKPQAPRALRLYVFDCGVLHNSDMGRFSLKKEEVATTDMAVACFLIAHPRGTLMWETGAIADNSWKPNGRPVTVSITLPDGSKREVDVDKFLQTQLAEIGYSPADVKYVAMSHYHYDHTANSSEFASATWLVSPIERDAMFGGKLSGSVQPSYFSSLQKNKTILLKKDEYDVFGDGTVILKSAPGHTQGHQVLYLKLAKTGPVVLSGDLYHYPEEQSLDRVPTFEFSQDQTRASRATIDAFVKKMGAQLWIQHDFKANAKLKKSPQFYE